MTFREKVLEIVRNIPRGNTLTYKEVAHNAGNGKAVRAVGTIMRKNFNLKIPCHRIVCSDKTIGDYNRGKKMKEKLLRKEGVKFKKQGILLSVMFLFLLGFGTTVFAGTDYVLSEKELNDAIRPAVVRLINTISGEAQVPFISYDIVANKFSVANKDTMTISFEEEVVGTGFFVSSDGILITSPYFIQKDSVLGILAEKYISKAFDTSPFNQNKELQQSLELRAVEFLNNNIIISDSNINVILSQTQKDDEIVAEILNGEDTARNTAEIAILSILADNVPTLKFAPSSVRPKFYTFNFLSQNPNNKERLLQSYLLDGQLNNAGFSTKDPLAISSFGVPIFDEEGEVHGLIKRIGNNSASPVVSSTDIIRALAKSDIDIKKGTYRKNFIAGLSYFTDKKCKASINSFEKASSVDMFIGIGAYIDTYTAQCQDLISTGGSLDTLRGVIRSFIDNSFPLFVLSILFIVILLLYMIKIVRQMLIQKKIKNNIQNTAYIKKKTEEEENNNND